MSSRILSGIAGLVALALHSAVAQAQCPASAIGTVRHVEVDATGGPRFGHNQYAGPEFLKPGEVVLTFDDGPHKELTPVVLQALEAHCAKATFFMVGQRAMMYPGLVREVAARGHTIATHTWSHRNLKEAGQDAGLAEIELGISGVQRALGRPAAPFFRFPYLSDPAYATGHLRKRNTAIFSIDVDSQDFRTRSPTVVMRNVMAQLKPKGRGILLFHDIQPSTAGALGALLSDLKANGFRVVHLVPRGGQTTLAEYDRKIASQRLGGVETGQLALARRTAVNPAWEPRVIPLRVPPGSAIGPASPAAAALPAPPAAIAPGPPGVAAVRVGPPRAASGERPARQREEPDWRTAVFRGY
jgi:peptidoglycan/xylan/chitin deacetylase (PgdA/CDA1 family)